MSKGAKLAGGTHPCIQKLASRAQWRVDLVKRGKKLMGRTLLLSVSIPPHPRHRSRTLGNLTVCEQCYFQSCLIGPTDDADSPAIPNKVQDALISSHGEPNATDKNRLELRESTATAMAKMLLHATKESADAFPPLKSVVGSLCFILDNYEV